MLWAVLLTVVGIVAPLVPSRENAATTHSSAEVRWVIAAVLYLATGRLAYLQNGSTVRGLKPWLKFPALAALKIIRENLTNILAGCAFVASILLGAYVGIFTLLNPPNGGRSVVVWIFGLAFIMTSGASVWEFAAQFRALDDRLGSFAKGCTGFLLVVTVIAAKNWGHWSWGGFAIATGVVLTGVSAWHRLLDPPHAKISHREHV